MKEGDIYMAKTKSSNNKRNVWLTFLAAVVLYMLYKTTVGSNVIIESRIYYFYVSEEMDYKSIADTLKERGVIGNKLGFKLMANINDPGLIKRGMYEIKKDWSNIKLINHFKTHQPKATYYLSLPTVRKRSNLIYQLCKGSKIHPDDIRKVLNDRKFLKEKGFTPENIYCVFLPKNYRIYSSSNARQLVERMIEEYRFFWNRKRKNLAEDMRLSSEEVCVLSSIVYSETKYEDEMPEMAGVYLNRLQNNMRLESDPTVVFASKRFDAKRVLIKDRNVRSPYNTYRNKGLPPGPISMVPLHIIDIILDYDGHDYLYFCADPDMSGKHVFAETFEEHKENAARYRNRLNEENILH